ncbi:MAG: CAP domain-containing protein [Thermoflavifilum sp.]|nr:CAP domain-containing protein [Thermoflavifilum sp.]
MEKAILEVINRMRSHPAAFYTQVIEPYVRQKPTAIHFTHSYVHSLRKEMLALSALPPLVENDTLQQTALELARDIVEHQGGRLSHNTSQGLDFAQRFQQAGIGCGAENLYTGTHRTAEDVVADWLIDQGVPSLGHRKNLLHSSYTRAGLVVLTNPKGQIWVVLDLGCDP